MRFTEIISEDANPKRQAAIAIAMKKAGKKPKGVAEGLENYNGIQLSLSVEKDDEFVDDDDTDNQTIHVQATASGRELGQVVFAIDYDDKGMILVPQDLEVDERFRGQGIAATMYDYVKSKGYRIHRSSDQTPAGAGFWDKHKPGKDIWEQGVAEGNYQHNYGHEFKDFKAELEKKHGQGNVRIQGDGNVADAYHVKTGKHLGFIDGSHAEVNDQGVAEGLPGSLSQSDYTPGATVKNPNTSCKRCHGRGTLWKAPDGKILPANDVPGAKKYKCGACDGIGMAKKEVDEGENWSKHNNPRAGGMSKKSVSSYRRSHPGSKIQTAVTTKPSKLKKGSKAAKRRASFCARMRGMKKHRTGAKTARDPNSNINKSLRRWHCESIEELHELVMLAEQYIRNNKK